MRQDQILSFKAFLLRLQSPAEQERLDSWYHNTPHLNHLALPLKIIPFTVAQENNRKHHEVVELFQGFLAAIDKITDAQAFEAHLQSYVELDRKILLAIINALDDKALSEIALSLNSYVTPSEPRQLRETPDQVDYRDNSMRRVPLWYKGTPPSTSAASSSAIVEAPKRQLPEPQIASAAASAAAEAAPRAQQQAMAGTVTAAQASQAALIAASRSPVNDPRNRGSSTPPPTPNQSSRPRQ